MNAADKPDPAASHRRVGRDAAAIVLAMLALLALFVGNLAYWVRHHVYDTPAVVVAAQQITGSADTQAAVTALLDEKVIRPALEQASGALPSILQGLGGSLTDQTAGLVEGAVADAVASQTAQEISTRLVATVNGQLVEGSGPIALTPAQLLDIVAPSLADNRAVAGLVDLADRSGCCTVVLAQRGELPFVWQHVSAIRTAGVVLPIVALALGLAAVAVARRRVRIGIVLAIGIVATGALTLVALAAGVHWGVEGIGDPATRSTALVRQAARITFDVTVGDLRTQCWLLIVAGAIGAGALIAVRAARRGGAPAAR